MMLPKLAESANLPYLGDKTVVEGMLRLGVQEVFDARPGYEGKVSEIVIQVGTRVMTPFLGGDPDYAIVDGWNKPGVIDLFVAKWCGVDEQDPTMVMVGAFADLFSKLLDVEAYARQPGVTPEQWQPQAQAAIDRLAWILVGLTPGQQVVM
jgi:hypothetical protein